MPYNILNYALALTPVSFLVYTVASGIATIPWTCLYVYMGTLSNDLIDLAHGKIRYFSRQHISRCFKVVSNKFI
jgi:uncharacterized membrane protein YdjX (TVP38/TMEM64 family)